MNNFVMVGSVCLNVISIAVMLVLLYRVYFYEKRLHELELSVVRSVMEENPTSLDLVFKTAKQINTYLSCAESWEEAKRLHGIKT